MLKILVLTFIFLSQIALAQDIEKESINFHKKLTSNCTISNYLSVMEAWEQNVTSQKKMVSKNTMPITSQAVIYLWPYLRKDLAEAFYEQCWGSYYQLNKALKDKPEKTILAEKFNQWDQCVQVKFNREVPVFLRSIRSCLQQLVHSK